MANQASKKGMQLPAVPALQMVAEEDAFEGKFQGFQNKEINSGSTGNPNGSYKKQPGKVLISSAISGNAVAQRIMRTHETNSDEGVVIDALGDTGFINEYARLFAMDGKALVDGEPKGKPGLVKTLKKAVLDGKALAASFVQSLMDSGTWLPTVEKDLKSVVDYVSEENQFSDEMTFKSMKKEDDGLTLSKYIIDMDFAGSYREDVETWLTAQLALGSVTTLGQLTTAASKLPLIWHGDLAYLAYESIRDIYYSVTFKSNPYIPPFKELISDINSGEVTSFTFESKYGSEENDNLGAEFTVAAPGPLNEKYDDIAVMHTHYAAEDQAPNYGHTKPYERRFDTGFGYTVVKTSKINAVDDSQKKYEDL